MIKQIIFYLVMIASFIGGIYILFTFESAYKLFSIILLCCSYGFFRQKITGKW